MEGVSSGGGQRFQQPQVFGVETFWLCIHQFDDADYPLRCAQRDGERGAPHVARRFLDAGEIALVFLHVVEEQALPVLLHPARDALALRQSPAAHQLAVRADQFLTDQLSGRLVL